MRIKQTVRRMSAAVVALVLMGGLVISATAPAQAITAESIVTRAQSWVAAHVPYSQSDYYTNQYGTYRTDCSGFVSMAWGLGQSLTTVTLPSVSHVITKDDLQPGDILLNSAPGGNGHVIIFAGWANAARTAYNGYESSPAYNGAHFSANVPYPYWAGYGTFIPYRYNNYENTPADRDQDGVPDTSDRCPDQPGSAATGGCPDTDGDAVADYGGGLTKGWVFPGTPTGLSNKSTVFWDSGLGNWETNRTRFVGGDFNGDGRTDVAAFYDYGSGLTKGWVFPGTPTGLSNKSTVFWDSGLGNWETNRTRFVGGAAMSVRMRNTGAPTITGEPAVGIQLTASPGTWSPEGSHTFQWRAEGTAISGANSSTYTLTVVELGKRISVRVTGSRAGYTPASATSELTPAIAPGTITNTSRPTVRGKKRVGKTLTASPGSWSPDGLTVKYQWLRDDKAVQGATARRYRLKKANKGHRVSVRVTVSIAGYTTASKTSKDTPKIK